MDDTTATAGANDKPVYVPDDMYNALRRIIDDMEQAREKLLRAREEREEREEWGEWGERGERTGQE